MNKKNNKGITLVILTITVIVLLIICSITIYNAQSQLAIKKFNNLYNDIDSIDSKVSAYYLKNNSIPIYDKVFLSSKSELQALFIQNGANSEDTIINPNDEGEYYVLDLSKLENLTLNYGREFSKWESDTNSSSSKYQDLYIINKTTHQIYYPLGIYYNETYYFSKKIDENNISEISMPSTSDEWQVNINDANTTSICSDLISLTAKITLALTSNYNENSLEYAWSELNDEANKDDIVFTKFSMNSENSATLSSRAIDSSLENYYLWIKVLDKNGNEHISIKTITIE